jgi:uncharacterized protein (UPF0303 family)
MPTRSEILDIVVVIDIAFGTRVFLFFVEGSTAQNALWLPPRLVLTVEETGHLRHGLKFFRNDLIVV